MTQNTIGHIVHRKIYFPFFLFVATSSVAVRPFTKTWNHASRNKDLLLNATLRSSCYWNED